MMSNGWSPETPFDSGVLPSHAVCAHFISPTFDVGSILAENLEGGCRLLRSHQGAKTGTYVIAKH